MRSARQIAMQQDAAGIIRQSVVPGGEWLAAMPYAEIEELTATLGGTVYPVFVLGAHDPDDTDTDRVVP